MDDSSTNKEKRPITIREFKIFIICSVLIFSGFIYVNILTIDNVYDFDERIIASGLPIVLITTNESIKPYTYTQSLVRIYEDGSDAEPINYTGKISLVQIYVGDFYTK